MSENVRDDGYGLAARPASREASRMAMTIYVIYAINLAFPGPFGIIGVVLAYLNRGEAAGTWLESHYRWEIRTFWISLAWLVIGIATVWLVVGFLILGLLWLWWAIRIAIGWSQLAKERPVPKPGTWFL